MADEEVDRINQNWPPGLKDEIKAAMGNARGVVTDFTVEAVRVRLRNADALKEYEADLLAAKKEIGELRYLAQQLADRYVIGGGAEDREAFLMELQLPAWLSTEGWPADLAAQKPVRDPVAEPVQAQPTQAEVDSFVATAERITGVPDMPVPPGTAANEVKLTESVVTAGGSPAGTYTAENVVDDTELHKPMFMTGGGDDFLAKVQAKGAEKGIDVSGLGLIPASKVPAPDKVIDPNPHNHSWERVDGVLCCSCGAWVDESDPKFPQGIVREGARPEVTTEPAPALEVQTPVPTSVAAPIAAPAPIEVDF